MQKKDTGHIYAMKILRKQEMLEKEQVSIQYKASLLLIQHLRKFLNRDILSYFVKFVVRLHSALQNRYIHALQNRYICASTHHMNKHCLLGNALESSE